MTTRDLDKLLAEQNEEYARYKRDRADQREHEPLYKPQTPEEELRRNFEYTHDQLSALHSLIEKNHREVLRTIKAARDYILAVLLFGMLFVLWLTGA